MTILPKKKLNQNKNDDGGHSDAERDHHAHGHGHRDRVEHGHGLGVVGHHVQRADDTQRGGPGHGPVPNSRACWQARDEKRQGGIEADEIDGPTSIKRRHRDGIGRGHFKNCATSTGNAGLAGVSVSPGLGAVAGASGVSNSRMPDEGAGPSGFTPPNSKVRSSAGASSSEVFKPGHCGDAGREDEDDDEGGACGEAVNSDDEYDSFMDRRLTEDEWKKREEEFEKLMAKKRFVIKQMEPDGACLFRAVADQVYGDQEMHAVVRANCMDYIAKNADFFSVYLTEDFESYVRRKRLNHVHGNNIEIQALSEMYNRPIEVYCYSSEPINTFHGEQRTDNPPLRLSHHRRVHYNSITDPWAPTIGVGLGLPGIKPGVADKKVLQDAIKQNERSALEQAMLEDKLKATDWEATDDAIERQVAKESYLEWLKDQGKKKDEKLAAPSRGHASRSSAAAGRGGCAGVGGGGHWSPKPGTSSRLSPESRHSSSAGSSPSLGACGSSANSSVSEASGATPKRGNMGLDFNVEETASFLNNLPPEMFGLSDFEENDLILARVLAASQQEYLNSLKKKSPHHQDGSGSSSDSPSGSASLSPECDPDPRPSSSQDS